MRPLLASLLLAAPALAFAAQSGPPGLVVELGRSLPAVTEGPAAEIAARLSGMAGISQLARVEDFAGAHAVEVLSPVAERLARMTYEGAPLSAESFAGLPPGVRGELLARALAEQSREVSEQAQAIIRDRAAGVLDANRIRRETAQAESLLVLSHYYFDDPALKAKLAAAQEGFSEQLRQAKRRDILAKAQRQLAALTEGGVAANDEDWPAAATSGESVARDRLHDAARLAMAWRDQQASAEGRRQWQEVADSLLGLETHDLFPEQDPIRPVQVRIASLIASERARGLAEGALSAAGRERLVRESQALLDTVGMARAELQSFKPKHPTLDRQRLWAARTLIAEFVQDAQARGDSVAEKGWSMALAVFTAVLDQGSDATPGMVAEVLDMVRPLLNVRRVKAAAGGQALSQQGRDLLRLLTSLSGGKG